MTTMPPSRPWDRIYLPSTRAPAKDDAAIVKETYVDTINDVWTILEGIFDLNSATSGLLHVTYDGDANLLARLEKIGDFLHSLPVETYKEE